MLNFFSRLDTYMKFRGLNDNKITLECSLANGIIGKARKRGALSQENIVKILDTYPDLNANWLFRGNGTMLTTEISRVSEPSGEYKSCCQECSNKDVLIETQKVTIIALKEAVTALKKDPGLFETDPGL